MTDHLFKYSVDSMVGEMRPGSKWILMILYGIMTLAFFIAVIAYGAVNATPLLNGGNFFEIPFVETTATVLDFPALTICPVDRDASVNVVSCGREDDNAGNVDCKDSQKNVNVNILGYGYLCVQINNPSASKLKPVQAVSATSTFVSRISINTTNTAQNDPTGAFMLIHDQSAAASAGFWNSFVATPGYLQLVFLRNSTAIKSNGDVKTEFQTMVSKTPLKDYDQNTQAPGIQFVDVRVAYPNMVSYIQNELIPGLSELYKGRFIVEAGGLAALLFFLHRIVMWIVTFPLYWCCRVGGGKGGDGDVSMNAL